ncbi:lipase 1 isoform X2 [Nilaparvata lugens]|nr:lipase 1 isoform X2 [Nilaparvata lugens]
MERIRDAGWRGEEHKVVTEDGYILTVFRIPPQKSPSEETEGSDDGPIGRVTSFLTGIASRIMGNDDDNEAGDRDSREPRRRLPVLVQHGIFLSSDGFLVDSDGLAFVLAREGWDVWLGNARGNAYSRAHILLNPSGSKFWDFSWHEMGTKDLPAMIDYVLSRTGRRQLHYIGHSMGSTVFFVMGAMLPRYNRRVRTMVSLSPIGRMTKWHFAMHNNSLLYSLMMSEYARLITEEKMEFLPREDLKGTSNNQVLCWDVLINFALTCEFIIRMGRYLIKDSSQPAGISINTGNHFIQNIGSASFRPFDYRDTEKNMKVWGESPPPEYPLERIRAPVAIFYTAGDELISEQDAEYMISKLPNVIRVWKTSWPMFSHFDFTFTTVPTSLHKRREMHQEVLSILEERDSFRL